MASNIVSIRTKATTEKLEKQMLQKGQSAAPPTGWRALPLQNVDMKTTLKVSKLRSK